MAWEVLENTFNFVDDQTEWIGTVVRFDIVATATGTELRFTHEGLVPTFECYEACSQGWGHYVEESLRTLITTGEGQPNAAGTARTDFERELGVGHLE
jgi:hypothetical protein